MMEINRLILGDNLEVLKRIDSESVDLIYLDPPFFSNRNYEVIWGDEGEVRSFKDRWSGGIDHYIAWLKERVIEMHRVLKDTGSIFLHCDWHANAYIRVEILDRIFGYQNFRGEIIWQRTNAHNDAKKKLSVLSDTIWYYTKSNKYFYKPVYGKLNESYIDETYNNEDSRGKYKSDDMTAPGVNQNDLEWKGFHPSKKGRHWAINKEAVIGLLGEERAEKMNTIEKMNILYENGYIEISKNGTPRFKRYLDTSKGKLIGNVWLDINNVQSQAKERIGYPTQKPEALVQRIIEMASIEDDIVLDPFVGGGTTISVAEKLKRRWIGVDQSVQAIKVTEMRLQKSQDLFSSPFSVELHKYDYDTLRYKNAFEFESWIVEQYGGISNRRQRNDFGLDGKMPDNTPIQVKRSDNIGRNVIDNFYSAVQRSDKQLFDKKKQNQEPVGYIIAFSFSRGAIQEVARLKNTEGVIIKLVDVGDIVPISKKPLIKVSIKNQGRDNKGASVLEFEVSGTSDAGVEFYSWDFTYSESEGFKADVMIDKEGKETIKLKPGKHTIAVKAVDNDGLEAIEVLKIKVNGEVVME